MSPGPGGGGGGSQDRGKGVGGAGQGGEGEMGGVGLEEKTYQFREDQNDWGLIMC